MKPSFEELIETFTTVMHTKDNTSNSYRVNLMDFKRFLDDRGVDFYSARLSHVKAYKNYLEDKVKNGEYKQATRYSKLCSVKSFYTFVNQELEGEVQDLGKTISNPKPNNESDVFMPYDEVKLFLDYFKNSGRMKGERNAELLKARDMLYIVMALKFGFRVSEMINLKPDQVDLVNRTITITNRKNNCDLTVPLDEEIMGLYLKYMEIRGKSNPLCEEVFISSRGKKLDRKNVNDMIRERIKKANIYLEKQGNNRKLVEGVSFTSHKFRHTASYLMGRQNMTLPEIGKVLGQKSINTTARYSHASIEEIRDKSFNLL